MDADRTSRPPRATTIAPWLAVGDAAAAVKFYAAAFGAVEAYRLDGEAGRVGLALLTIDGAPFWLQDDRAAAPGRAASASVRMILSVNDPDAFFDRAIAAGAIQVAPIHEEYGWRTGRVTDPFGYDWEFSKQLES